MCVGGCRAGDRAGRGHRNGTQSKPSGEPGVRSGGSPEQGPDTVTLKGRSPEQPGAFRHPGAAFACSYRQDQEFELCCCREALHEQSGGCGLQDENPQEDENHRQGWCLAKAAAPCPVVKLCKGQVKSGARSPQQPFTCNFSISGEVTRPRRENSGAF